ncbi:MAG: protein kinase [Chloroflexi bacterium]|nr:protein kinase [Chloroflexota bacterium]MCC6893938.1 protein kinase [Anaerolineae bacterium]
MFTVIIKWGSTVFLDKSCRTSFYRMQQVTMSSDPIIGKKLGDYLIVDILGQGGMARVYRGLDKKLNRYAAVKVIDASSLREDEAEYRKRFQSEARAIARLNHPNIVGIYQFDQVDTLYYMAMSFIEGRDLRNIIKTHDRNGTRMSGTEVRNIIRDIGSALDYAHSEGVIHRDIKPSNIMVTAAGKAVLTDFGLALSVPEGTIGNTFGSAHYVAPEQAVNSAQAVAQSDIYSLGIVLFEMLTNRVPFDDPSAMAVAMKHLTDPPPPPSKINASLSPQVDRVVIQALDKDPKKRFTTCAEMLKALEKAMGVFDTGDSTTKMPLKTAPLATPISKPAGVGTAVVDETKDTTEVEVAKAPPGFETSVFPPAIALPDSPTVTDSKASLSTRNAIIAAQAEREAKQKRSRRNKQLRQAAIPVVVILIALVGGLFLLSNNSNQVITDAQTRTALLATGTGTTDEATSIAAAVTDEATDEATEPVTDEPATAVPETEAATNESTATTESATVTPLPVTEATATTELAPATETFIPTVSIGDVTPNASPTAPSKVVLRYDDQVLTLFNQSSTPVNVGSLRFVQITAAGTTIEYSTQEWAAISSRPITALPAGDCLQVLRNDRFLSAMDTKPDYCDFVQAWRQISFTRLPWVSDDSAAVFEVRRGTEVLATCKITNGQCGFDP